ASPAAPRTVGRERLTELRPAARRSVTYRTVLGRSSSARRPATNVASATLARIVRRFEQTVVPSFHERGHPYRGLPYPPVTTLAAPPHTPQRRKPANRCRECI